MAEEWREVAQRVRNWGNWGPHDQVEVFRSEVEDAALVFHLLTIRDRGMMLGEIWDLEVLSQDCAQDGAYAFLLAAQPLRFSGAMGSPVNPVAIK
jgi:kynurenine formamidase